MKKAVVALTLLCLMMSLALVSVVNASPPSVHEITHVWHGWPGTVDTHQDQSTSGTGIIWRWPSSFAWCGVATALGIAVSIPPSTFDLTLWGIHIRIVFTVKATWHGQWAGAWLGGHATAWGAESLGSDPVLANVSLPYGINMTQDFQSFASYTISVVDLNTSTTIQNYQASITNGTWAVSPNWAGNWTFIPQTPAMPALARLSPRTISTPVPKGHLVGIYSTANATSYANGSNATAADMPGPPSNATAAVGGNVVPVDKLALLGLLLAPYVPSVGLALAAIIAVAVAASIYVKRVKRRQGKQ